MDEISYLLNREIDRVRWDACIDKAYNGLIYPYSFFLDSMTDKKWDALVLNDYEAVFPLVWNSRFGLKFLYQPYFCQQLGLFSVRRIDEKLMHAFIRKIPGKFRYWNFHLNYENKFYDPAIRFINRTSYCIDLNKEYTDIYDHYKPDAKKNLAKAVLKGYSYRSDGDISLSAACFFESYGRYYDRMELWKERITSCAGEAVRTGRGFQRTVYGPDDELWCAGFFFMACGRIHYAMAAPTEAGKKYGATHILIDEVLKEFSGKNLVFDFEGSDISSVAYFYSKFGSSAFHYLQLLRNRLPWWCRFLKE